MKTLHIVPEINEANGVYQVARMLARESGDEVVALADVISADIVGYSEVWVHGMWLPREWCACWKAIRAGKKLVRMSHGSLSPIYLERQGKWKKKLVAPVERWLFKRTDHVVVTCETEKVWCQEWGLRNEFEVVDLKRFFDLNGGEGLGQRSRSTVEDSLHVLYLGRRHPLKGVNYLEQAVEELKNHPHSNLNWPLELHCVSDHFGEELEKDWKWCDVLCLPTLSENFGLVVAEALERGKYVITTDGAPAWAPDVNSSAPTPNNCTYIRGYRDGSDAERVRLLKEALEKVSSFRFQDKSLDVK